ncbi:MAG: hypothetical protein IKF98_05810 [Clostridia bacterium]|nr:hypothetical protein [Clostridia bacterium]
MKRLMGLLLALTVLLGGAFPGACAEAGDADAYLGFWVAEGARAEIWREDDELRCRVVFICGDEDSDVWAFDYCWIDEESGMFHCGSVTRTHQHYDTLWETLQETDWSLNDMPFSDFQVSETGIRFTDEKLDAPLEFKRLDGADGGMWGKVLAYVGRWTCEGATLRVEDYGAAYLFTVAVPLDAGRTGKWTYTCRYDAEGERMVSVDVSNRTLITPTADGGTIEEEVGRDNSKAAFTLEGESLVWSDVTDGDGEDMTFERVGG